MQDLRVIGVENGALLVASDDGTRFRIPIDEVLQSKLRQSVPDPGTGRKLAPKEIQAHIRSGMSAQDVASITGVPLEYIQRFEGPVIAEREFVVQSALDVPVHTAADTDPMRQGKTFGTAIRERLHDLGGINERWASWKDADSGWVVKLSFTANQIDHDARWGFDPKKQALSPMNNEAITLSQQGDAAGTLMPRLRAVSATADHSNAARFDSGAFAIDQADIESPAVPGPIRISRAAPVEDDSQNHGNQTADLLEALRRRRGEREAAAFGDEFDPRAAHPSSGSIHIVEVEMDVFTGEEQQPRITQPQPIGRGSKKGRVAMPSWDEIVFGARPDDDLA
ncbi:septation protein SepH [soil metagenome]